jgi:hypothetical protein
MNSRADYRNGRIAMNTNWVCQICHKPAPDHCVIEVINSNIDHGSIGGYPVMASEDEQAATERLREQIAKERGVAPEHVAFSIDDVTDRLSPQINIAFVVRHIECTRDQDNEGYWLGADRANTLGEWAGWVIHLSEKTWMGRDDLVRMLAFWWTHRGDQPPANM